MSGGCGPTAPSRGLTSPDSGSRCSSTVIARGPWAAVAGAARRENRTDCGMLRPHPSGAGYDALADNTSGEANTALGESALFSNTTGSDNPALGLAALDSNTSGNFNTASGLGALQYNTTGDNNTASGIFALQNNTSGGNNNAVGLYAMGDNNTGSGNTAVGVNALGTNHGGSNNVAVGSSAGYNVRGGNYNIEIGNVGTANDVGTIRNAIAAIGPVSVSASASRKPSAGGKDGRPMRKMRVRGFRSAGFMTALTIGCHSLLRVAKLLPEPALVPT